MFCHLVRHDKLIKISIGRKVEGKRVPERSNGILLDQIKEKDEMKR